MNRLILILMVLSSCKTVDWAKECANRYPPRTETIKEEIHIRADNSQIYAAIQAVKDSTTDLILNIKRDSAYASDSISQACAELIASYQGRVKVISGPIRYLPANPCAPDTLIRTITNNIANTAKEERLTAELKRERLYNVMLGLGIVTSLVIVAVMAFKKRSS